MRFDFNDFFLRCWVAFNRCVPFIVFWLFTGQPILSHNYLTLYQTTDYDFFIDLYFDRITAVYLFVGSLLTFMVTIIVGITCIVKRVTNDFSTPFFSLSRL